MMKIMAFNLKNKLGIWGERVAEQQYLQRGFVLVARNIYNTRGKMMGEIDLVVRSHKTIVFVEVKVRNQSKYGTASESITKAKRLKLIKTIQWFIRRFPQYQNLQPRIDVCAIDVARCEFPPDFSGNLDKKGINVIIIPSAVTLDY